jgi:hypothetical protein
LNLTGLCPPELPLYISLKLAKELLFLAVAVQNQIATTLHQRSHDRPDGSKMPFWSEMTLHIVDRVLWMRPFATNTDLNEAAKKADISHELRNGFLQKLLDEHSIIGARQQLKGHWGEWIESSYGAAGPESAGRGYGAEAETPEDSDDEVAVDVSQAPGSAAAGAAAAAEPAEPAAAAAESSAFVAAQAAAAAAGPAPAAAVARSSPRKPDSSARCPESRILPSKK